METVRADTSSVSGFQPRKGSCSTKPKVLVKQANLLGGDEQRGVFWQVRSQVVDRVRLCRFLVVLPAFCHPRWWIASGGGRRSVRQGARSATFDPSRPDP